MARVLNHIASIRTSVELAELNCPVRGGRMVPMLRVGVFHDARKQEDYALWINPGDLTRDRLVATPQWGGVEMTPTNLDRVKTLIVDALNASGGAATEAVIESDKLALYDRSGDCGPYADYFDADRLATTILTGLTAIVLDREAVRAALDDIVSGVEIDRDHGSIGQLGGRRAYYRYEPGPMRPNIRIEDDVVDRLIDSLAGGPSS